MCYFYTQALYYRLRNISHKLYCINWQYKAQSSISNSSSSHVRLSNNKEVRHISVSCYFLILLTHHLQMIFLLSINSSAPCTQHRATPVEDSNLYLHLCRSLCLTCYFGFSFVRLNFFLLRS